MFKIMMFVKRTGRLIDMPGMQDLGLFKASQFCEIYKKKNPDCRYYIVNQENGDYECVY